MVKKSILIPLIAVQFYFYPVVINNEVTLIDKKGIEMFRPDNYIFLLQGSGRKSTMEMLKDSYKSFSNYLSVYHTSFITTDGKYIYQHDSTGKEMLRYLLEDDSFTFFHFTDNSPRGSTIIPLIDHAAIEKLKNKQFNFSIKNENGKVIAGPIQGNLESFFGFIKVLPRNYILFKDQNDKNYVVNINGKPIVSTNKQIDQFISPDFIIFQEDDQWGVMNDKEELIIAPQHKKLRYAGIDNLLTTSNYRSGKTKLFNVAGDTIGVFDGLETFIGNYAVARKKFKVGVINSKGKWVVEPKYTIIKHVKDNIFLAGPAAGDVAPYYEVSVEAKPSEDKNKYEDIKDFYIIDVKKGKTTKLNLDLGNATVIDEKYILNFTAKDSEQSYKETIIYSIRGEAITPKFDELRMPNIKKKPGTIVLVKNESGWSAYDVDRKSFVTEAYNHLNFGTIDLSNYHKFIVTNESGKQGVVDDKGKWILKPVYHNVEPYAGPMTLVMRDPVSYEYINGEGKTIWSQPKNDLTVLNEEDLKQRFKDCKPSIYRATLSYNTLIEYEILGEAKDIPGCRIKTQYIANPNREWTGKAMVCTYNNEKPFKEIIRECMEALTSGENKCNCDGELANLLLQQNK